MSADIVDDLAAVLQIERLIAERKMGRLKRRTMAYTIGGLCLAVAWIALTAAAVVLMAEAWSLTAALLVVAAVNVVAALGVIVILTRDGEDETDAVLQDLRGRSLEVVRRDARAAIGALDPRTSASSDTVRLVEQLLPIVLPLVMQAASRVRSSAKSD